MSEVDDRPTECPGCGASWVRSSYYFAVLGDLSDMPFTEAAEKYGRNPEQYDDRPVRKFACGRYEVYGDE